MATCPKCNARVDLGDDFCPDCGASIGESSAAKTEKSYKSGRSENIQCPRCGTELSGNARFCPKCGANQLVNCSKCGAKLGKTEKFCTGCGQRIIRPVSAAGNSLSCGIFSLFMGWIPVLGWLFIFFSLFYGFRSLRWIKQGNEREKRGMAIAGIVLGFISLLFAFIALMGMIYGNAPQAGTPLMNTDIPLANGGG